MQTICSVSACSISSCLRARAELIKKKTPLPPSNQNSCVKCFGRSERRRDAMERLATPLVAAAAIITLSTSSLVSAPVAYGGQSISSNGAALFQKACIGCHDMGGNIFQPGATLFLKDLQRNGVDTEDGIYCITYYGKGRMPGFGERCTPRGQCTFGPRLQEDEIKLLAEFVKSQADGGWPRIESYGD